MAPLRLTATERDEHDNEMRFFSDFLHRNREEWEKKIEKEIHNGRSRIAVDLKELRKEKAGLDQRLLESPAKYLLPWEDALLSFLKETNEKAVRQLKQPLKLSVQGAFGRNHVTPRGMTAATLGQLMCVEGIVTRAGLVQPKLVQSIHVRKDAAEGHPEVTARDHRDATALVEQPLAGTLPTMDADGNPLEMEIGLSVYKSHQIFTVQEAPESMPRGQVPKNVEVICEGELADKAKPGDRVQVVGVYRSFPGPAQDYTSGIFPARIIATSITPVKDLTESPFVYTDMTNIKAVGSRPDAFKLLSRSFAPAICGHDTVKEGLLLQMIGGTERNLKNGTHLRGDINVLLVGDPSCGKSQMLRFVMNASPLAIATTGRGSSGVGLTAAMTKDAGSRDFHLEAGAMVLADRGVICIDEFDKMGAGDRVAIHEAMEQQCVTIAKAGMHVKLNSRCAVTAAANPKYGTFDDSMDIAANINMPDSLLSRFDLVFVVRDKTNEEIDRRITTQVLRQAMLRLESESARRGVEQIHSSLLERKKEADQSETPEATKVYERGNGDASEIVTVDFLRKYVKYCKRFTPVLSARAQEVVSEKYVDMRMRFQSSITELSNPNSTRKPRLAVTTRTLEALIRLATAHAKLKLRKDEVLEEDVLEAYRLMLAAREEDAPAAEGVPAVDAGDEGPEGGDDAPGGDDADGQDGPPRKRAKRSKGPGSQITSTRLATLSLLVAKTFASTREQQLDQGTLLEAVNAGLQAGEGVFSQSEFTAGLAQMEVQNKLLLSEAGLVLQTE
jgi:DNA replication licensing factor MCM3